MNEPTTAVKAEGNAPRESVSKAVRTSAIRASRDCLADVEKLISRARYPLIDTLGFEPEEIKILDGLHQLKVRARNLKHRLGKLPVE